MPFTGKKNFPTKIIILEDLWNICPSLLSFPSAQTFSLVSSDTWAMLGLDSHTRHPVKPKCSQPAQSMLHGFLRLQQKLLWYYCSMTTRRLRGWQPWNRLTNTRTSYYCILTERKADVLYLYNLLILSILICLEAKQYFSVVIFVPKHVYIYTRLWNGLALTKCSKKCWFLLKYSLMIKLQWLNDCRPGLWPTQLDKVYLSVVEEANSTSETFLIGHDWLELGWTYFIFMEKTKLTFPRINSQDLQYS